MSFSPKSAFTLIVLKLAFNETHSCWCPWPQQWCPWAAGECQRAALSCLCRTYPLWARLGAPSRSRRCIRHTRPGQKGAQARSLRPPINTCTHTLSVINILKQMWYNVQFFLSPFHSLLPHKSTHKAIGAIVLAAFNLIQRGVREIKLLSTMVYGKAVGSANAITHDHQHVTPGQRRPHDAGSQLVPVRPEHQPGSRRVQIKMSLHTAVWIQRCPDVLNKQKKSNLGSSARQSRLYTLHVELRAMSTKNGMDRDWRRCLTLGTHLEQRLGDGHLQTWWPPSPCWRRRCVSGPLCGG